MTVKDLKHFIDTECKDIEDAIIYGTFNEDDFFPFTNVSKTIIDNKPIVYFKE